MGKLFGVLMLILFFAGLFWLVAKDLGMRQAVLIFGAAVGMTAFVTYAGYLFR